MKTDGNRFLKVTGVLEILFGVASIAMILWVLSQNPADFQVYGFNASDTLWTLVLIYGTAAIQIIAGVIGLLFSNNLKKAVLCQTFGIVLIVMQISCFGRYDTNAGSIVTNIISLIVPFLYYHGAAANKRQYDAEKLQ